MAQLEIKPTPRMVRRVLVVVAAALVLALIESYLLVGGTGNFFEPKATLTTYIPDSAGVLRDAEVRMNGIRIGNVSGVELVRSDARRPVRIRMRILSHYLRDVPQDSQTAVSADTMVSPKFIQVNTGRSLIPARADGVLESEPIQEAADRANQIQVLHDDLTQVDKILADLSSPTSPTGRLFMSEEIYDTVLRDVRGFDGGLHTFLTPQGEIGQAFYTLKLYNAMEDSAKSVDNALAQIENGQGSLGQAYARDGQYNEIVRELTGLRSALADMNAGKGSAGALLTDESTYRQVTRLLSGVDRTLTSVNAGEGPLGQLLANEQLYESLVGSLRRLERVMRDLHGEPRKYLRFKPFEKNPYRASPRPSAQANSRSSSFLPDAARR